MKTLASLVFLGLLIVVAQAATRSKTAVVDPLLKTKFGTQDLTCDLCVFVVGWIEKEVANGTEEHRIAEEVGFLCKILPWPLDNMCVWVIQQFVAIIINLLEDLLPAQRICYIVNMCQQLVSLFPRINITALPCAKCMYYAGYILQVTENLTDTTEIVRVTSNACSSFNNLDARSECFSFVSNPHIPKLLSSRATAEEICSMTGGCQRLSV
jgi:hypothetical protein